VPESQHEQRAIESMGKPEPPRWGITLIHEERTRQVQGEGYTAERDDEYVDQELVSAALAYACAGDYHQGDTAIDFWPWDAPFKPSDDPVRNLVKAGALIAAEIDRVLRKAEREAVAHIESVLLGCPACAARPEGADPGEWCGNGECSEWKNHAASDLSTDG
jgi:hypothetical protein